MASTLEKVYSLRDRIEEFKTWIRRHGTSRDLDDLKWMQRRLARMEEELIEEVEERLDR